MNCKIELEVMYNEIIILQDHIIINSYLLGTVKGFFNDYNEQRKKRLAMDRQTHCAYFRNLAQLSPVTPDPMLS